MKWKRWGSEASGYGNPTYVFSFPADEGKISLISVVGFVAAAPKAGSDKNLSVQRQVLIVLSAPGLTGPAAIAEKMPGVIGQNASEVDDCLFAVNMKCCGWSNAHLPVNYFWDGGLLLPGHILTLHYDFATFWPGVEVPDRANPNAPINLEDEYECLDAESHLTITWETVT